MSNPDFFRSRLDQMIDLRHTNRPPRNPVWFRRLRLLMAHLLHRFWPCDLPYLSVDWRGVVGHRQVTDAYLVALARHHGGKLASLDRGLVALHADVGVAAV